MFLDICFTPNEFDVKAYDGYIAVVIDAFRATTSITTACANGCKRIIPVKTVEEALEIKRQNPEVLLAGEREGMLIPGFNLGNSPYEYTKEHVADKTLVMTTTNGTQALNKVAQLHKVYAAAFVNAAAVTNVLHQAQENIIILCAGSDGRFSLEDTLCAGLLAERLSCNTKLSDTALAAMAMYRDFRVDLLNRVSESSHAKYLRSIGFEQDIALCLSHDTLSVVPVFADNAIISQYK